MLGGHGAESDAEDQQYGRDRSNFLSICYAPLTNIYTLFFSWKIPSQFRTNTLAIVAVIILHQFSQTSSHPLPIQATCLRVFVQKSRRAGTLALGNGGTTPFGCAAAAGSAVGRLALGNGMPTAGNGFALMLGTGTLGGTAKGVGKLLASDVTLLTTDVITLMPETAAGRSPVPLPSLSTQPLIKPTSTHRLEAVGT